MSILHVDHLPELERSLTGGEQVRTIHLLYFQFSFILFMVSFLNPSPDPRMYFPSPFSVTSAR